MSGSISQYKVSSAAGYFCSVAEDIVNMGYVIIIQHYLLLGVCLHLIFCSLTFLNYSVFQILKRALADIDINSKVRNCICVLILTLREGTLCFDLNSEVGNCMYVSWYQL